MNTTDEQNPKEVNTQMVPLQNVKKHPIICKFWMMGNCIKEDKCYYLHNEGDKNGFQNYAIGFNRTQSSTSECTMFKFGFCKNGSMCNFKHVTEIKNENELDKIELPLWYLEYIFEKPANLIFEEYEEHNKEETDDLKQKYLCNKKNFNNKSNKNYQKNVPNSNSFYKNYQFDIYAEKKDSIINCMNKKVRYFFIRNKNMNYVQFAMENNFILNSKQNSIKFIEAQKSCDEVIFVIFDEENLNFNGFCKFRKELDEKEITNQFNFINSFNKDLLIQYKTSNPNFSCLKVDWHWKTKLSYNKVELLKNPLDDNEFFVNSKDGQEVAIDLGYYICRFMIKRLTREEVQGYMDYKKLCDDGYKEKTNNERNANPSNEPLSQSHPHLQKNNEIVSKNLDGFDLNSIIYDEIQKSTLKTNNKSDGNIIVTNISNLQVNISQNSFTYDNRNRYEEYSKKDRIKNKHRPKSHYRYESLSKSHSNSQERKSKGKNKRSRSRSRSRSNTLSYKKNMKKKFSSGHGSGNGQIHLHSHSSDSELTVIVEDDTVELQDSNESKNKLLNNKRKSEYYGLERFENITRPTSESSLIKKDLSPSKRIILPTTEIKLNSENKIVKNKLFSNAMEKIAMNYLRNEKVNRQSTK